MVLCTGRTPSDIPAQASFKTRSNTQPSQLDHVMVDCGMLHAVQSCGVGPVLPQPLSLVRLCLPKAQLRPMLISMSRPAPICTWRSTLRLRPQECAAGNPGTASLLCCSAILGSTQDARNCGLSCVRPSGWPLAALKSSSMAVSTNLSCATVELSSISIK